MCNCFSFVATSTCIYSKLYSFKKTNWQQLLEKRKPDHCLKKKTSMNSKCTMTKPAILCSCRLLNHHFVYLLSERNTSHSHPRNCLGDSSVECLRDGRLPPSWQQRSCHQYNAKSVTNTHKTRKMAPLSQAAAAAHSSLPPDRRALPGGAEAFTLEFSCGFICTAQGGSVSQQTRFHLAADAWATVGFVHAS